MATFEEKIQSLDVSLFEAIPSQTTREDRLSLLALQKAVRNRGSEYAYLEIGSYMGGTLQPYLLDERCTMIYSIDLRPAIPPDARGIIQEYPENSTSNMLQKLRDVSPEGVSKMTCFDQDASAIDHRLITKRPRICLIDGEHTDSAVIADFNFCRGVVADQGIICFHDSNIIYGGLSIIVDRLRDEGVKFNAYALPLHVFVFEFGGCSVHESTDIAPWLTSNYVQYLAGLKSMDHYRDVYNSRSVRFLRFFHRRLLDIQNPKRIPHHFRKA